MDYLNINCTSNCIFQKEGKCTLETINFPQHVQSVSDCPYFQSKK